MKIYENGVIREATPEEIAEMAKEAETASKVIVQMSVEEVLRYLAPKLVDDVPDETAIHMVAYFSRWEDRLNKDNPYNPGADILLGERLSYAEKLWKCINPHKAQLNWTPDTAVSLFVEVSADEWPEIPEYITAENPWMNGQKGTWKGEHYICKMDNCVWNPEQLPSAWEKV